MYVDKVLLIAVLCTTGAWCSDRTLTQNARTFNTLFAWPQTLFNNGSFLPKLWPNRLQLREWAQKGIAKLLHFVYINFENKPLHIEFGPEDGLRAANAYQRRFGYRGEWLIKQLGNGLNPNLQ